MSNSINSQVIVDWTKTTPTRRTLKYAFFLSIERKLRHTDSPNIGGRFGYHFFFVLSFHRDARVCWITLWNRQKSNEHLVYGNTIRVQNIRWWMKNGSQFSALFNSTISSVFWSFMLSFLSLCVCVSRTLLVDSFRLHLFSSSSSSSFFAGDKIGITRP